MDYFKPHRELRDGLEFVDRTGGSKPLTLVVSASNGSLLNTDEAYQKMWRLHGALENEKDVGTVISLPTILGRRRPHVILVFHQLRKNDGDHVATKVRAHSQKFCE